MFKPTRLIILISGGFFLLLDQFFKYQVTHSWSDPRLFSPYFGWQQFFNQGIAFGLPIPNIAIVLLTVPMMALVVWLLARAYKQNHALHILAWSLVLGGALSNLLDRILYSHVVDYFLIGLSLINISDIMIVGGLSLVLIANKKNVK